MVHFGLKRHRNKIYHLSEVFIRVFLLLMFVELERWKPYVRKIQPEELWLYRNPMTDSYVPSHMLWTCVMGVPLMAIIVAFLFYRDILDLTSSSLVISLAVPLNGVITDIIKLVVGRPRPDFVYRCWPDHGGDVPEDGLTGDNTIQCSGDIDVILEGRKSFPSGHSSFSFASCGFVFLYLSVASWRLLLPLIFLLTPLTIALSRTADYHHHWQDILAGSILGFSIIWLVYRQHYPPLSCPNSGKPLAALVQTEGYGRLKV